MPSARRIIPCRPPLLEACDEAGLFVMDEAFDMWYRMKTRNDFSSAFYEEFPLILREMAAKDYNHPCVVLYSIGNEIPEIGSKKAIRFGKEMIGILKEKTAPALCSCVRACALQKIFFSICHITKLTKTNG